MARMADEEGWQISWDTALRVSTTEPTKTSPWIFNNWLAEGDAPEWAELERVCKGEIVIQYKDLSKYWKTKAPLALGVLGAAESNLSAVQTTYLSANQTSGINLDFGACTVLWADQGEILVAMWNLHTLDEAGMRQATIEYLRTRISDEGIKVGMKSLRGLEVHFAEMKAGGGMVVPAGWVYVFGGCRSGWLSGYSAVVDIALMLDVIKVQRLCWGVMKLDGETEGADDFEYELAGWAKSLLHCVKSTGTELFKKEGVKMRRKGSRMKSGGIVKESIVGWYSLAVSVVEFLSGWSVAVKMAPAELKAVKGQIASAKSSG